MSSKPIFQGHCKGHHRLLSKRFVPVQNHTTKPKRSTPNLGERPRKYHVFCCNLVASWQIRCQGTANNRRQIFWRRFFNRTPKPGRPCCRQHMRSRCLAEKPVTDIVDLGPLAGSNFGCLSVPWIQCTHAASSGTCSPSARDLKPSLLISV